METDERLSVDGLRFPIVDTCAHLEIFCVSSVGVGSSYGLQGSAFVVLCPNFSHVACVIIPSRSSLLKAPLHEIAFIPLNATYNIDE